VNVRLGLRSHLKALVKEPILLWEGLRSAFAMRRRYRLSPSTSYVDWRLTTAYGVDNAPALTVDMVHYLRWRRQMRALRKWEQVK